MNLVSRENAKLTAATELGTVLRLASVRPQGTRLSYQRQCTGARLREIIRKNPQNPTYLKQKVTHTFEYLDAGSYPQTRQPECEGSRFRVGNKAGSIRVGR